jgi:hypothetical protein
MRADAGVDEFECPTWQPGAVAYHLQSTSVAPAVLVKAAASQSPGA